MTIQIHPVDRHVGLMVRKRRRHLDMTQEQLGKQSGVSFQQIQKYEQGVNRVSASRLFDLASILEVEVNYFFPIKGNGDATAPNLN
jgi:transcriptional regulator with XRE-family HTH domain